MIDSVNIDEILPQDEPQTAVETAPVEVAPVEKVKPVSEASEPVAPVHKITHKRHWRRRNLALEFAPGEAVSVTRRLYRLREEYLLNGKICRLRDIQDLFSEPVWPAVTTPSSNRAGSDRYFPRSRWTGAPSSRKPPALLSFACDSERLKRVLNQPVRIFRASPTSFPRSIDR